jgi:hypothetical protein
MYGSGENPSLGYFFEDQREGAGYADCPRCPLYESVPPHLYGGTERVVSYLTEELVRQGHEATLFASGDSMTKATLVAPCERSLRLSPDCTDPLAHHAILYDEVLLRKDEFDILHFHTDYAHFPISKNLDLPVVTTPHGQCVAALASARFLFQATSDHRD